MYILALEVALSLPYARSLKAKRAVRQSLLTKLARQFSLSARETDLQEVSQELVVSAAFVCLTQAEGGGLCPAD